MPPKQKKSKQLKITQFISFSNTKKKKIDKAKELIKDIRSIQKQTNIKPITSIRKNTKESNKQIDTKIKKLKEQKNNIFNNIRKKALEEQKILSDKPSIVKIKIPTSGKLKDIYKIGKKIHTKANQNFRILFRKYERLSHQAESKMRDFQIGDEVKLQEAIDNLKKEIKQNTSKNVKKLNETGITYANELLSKKHIFSKREYNALTKNISNVADKFCLAFYTDGKITKMLVLNRAKPKSIKFFESLLTNNYLVIDKKEEYGSDEMNNFNVKLYDDFKILDMKECKNLKKKKNKNGGFFPKVNTSPLDLKDYQIYTEDDLEYDLSVKEDPYNNSKLIFNNEHCLIYTLLQHNKHKNLDIPIEFILTGMLKGTHISMSELKILSKTSYLSNYKITIRKYLNKDNRGNEKEEPIIFNKDKKTEINIGQYYNHFFIDKETKYTQFSIKNLEQTYGKNRWWEITSFEKRKNGSLKAKRDNRQKRLSSLELIRHLDNGGYFKDSVLLKNIDIHNEIKKEYCLHESIFDGYIDIDNPQQGLCDFKKISYMGSNLGIREFFKKIEQKIPDDIYFADLESETNIRKNNEMFSDSKRKCVHNVCISNCATCNTKHRVVMAAISKLGSDSVEVYKAEPNEDVSLIIKSLFDYIVRTSKKKVNKKDKQPKAIVYFHNMKYDWHVILNSSKNVTIKPLGIVKTDNNFYEVRILYNGKKINIRDSFKLLPIALSKFNKTFSLNLDKKEAIAYNYYTKDNVSENKVVKVIDYISHFEDPKDVDKFFEITKLNKEDYFNPIDYYKEYLINDVLVLKKGLIKFDETLKKGFSNIDTLKTMDFSLYNFLTIASIGHYCARYSGSYDNLNELKGNLRTYISQSAQGGRVCVNPKYLGVVVDKIVADYDGVSLYPSAMYRLGQGKGLPTGPPKIFTRLEDIKLTTNKNWELEHNYIFFVCSIRIKKVNKYQQMPFICVKDEETGILEYTNNPPPNYKFIVNNITLEDWVRFHHIEYDIVKEDDSYMVYWNNEGNKLIGDLLYNLFNQRLIAKKQKNEALSSVYKLIMNSIYGKTNQKKHYNSDYFVQEDRVMSYVYNYYQEINGCDRFNNNYWVINKNKVDNSYSLPQVASAILAMSKRIMNEVFNTANDLSLPIYYTDTDSIHMDYDDVPKLEKEYKIRYGRELNGKNLGQFHIDFSLDGCKTETIKSTKFLALGKKTYVDILEGEDKNGNIVNGYHFRAKGISAKGIQKLADEDYNGDVFELYKKASEEQDGIEIPMGLSFIYTKNGVHTRSADIYRTLKK